MIIWSVVQRFCPKFSKRTNTRFLIAIFVSFENTILIHYFRIFILSLQEFSYFVCTLAADVLTTFQWIVISSRAPDNPKRPTFSCGGEFASCITPVSNGLWGGDLPAYSNADSVTPRCYRSSSVTVCWDVILNLEQCNAIKWLNALLCLVLTNGKTCVEPCIITTHFFF